MILDMYHMAEAYVASGAAFDADSALDEPRRRLALLCESHEPYTHAYVFRLDHTGAELKR